MISREPTIERLAKAESLLLTPFGLTDAHLSAALQTIAAHRIDDADLYFQSTRHEGWSLEEGIVKSGSFSIDQGVGVRAVAGEKTAFAYSDDISEAALQDAARTVRTIAAAGQSKRVKVGVKSNVVRSRVLYAPDRPDHDARQHAEGGVAGKGRAPGARQGPAHRAGDGRRGGRIRRRAGGARRRHACGRRAPAGAPVGDGDRRAEGRRRRAPRGRHRRRRRPLRPGLFPGRRDRALCRTGRQRGADQSRGAAGTRRPDDRGARPGLARRAAARSDRPRARRRLQPQGLVGVLAAASASAWPPRA